MESKHLFILGFDLIHCPLLSTFLIYKKRFKNDLFIPHYISKSADRSRGRPEGSLFNSYYTEV